MMETSERTSIPETTEELFQRGEAAYDTGDFETALSLLKQAAEQGHAGAQYKCSVMYLAGEGTPVDMTQALLWGEKAAEQGHVQAQYHCGVSYHKGNGTAPNNVRSLMWYEKAAEQGHPLAQFNCGVMYEDGEGTQTDLSKALFWYGKAASQGHLLAMNNLGLMYRQGEEEKLKKMPEGVRLETALFWFDTVIQAGAKVPQPSEHTYLEDAQFNYAETLCQRGRPEDLAAALEWFEKLARQGDVQSQFSCAEMYEKGWGTEKNINQALMWYEEAARNGHKEAQWILDNGLF